MKQAIYIGLALAVGVGAGYGLSGDRAKPPPGAQTVAEVTETAGGVRAEGRVTTYPGAWVTLAGEQGGTLVELACDEKRRLAKGETVAVLRREEDRAALAEARARAGVAEAEVRLAESEARRAHDLAAEGFFSRQSVDRVDQALAAARARLDSARATVRRLAAALDRTMIVAPFAGTVVERLASRGETVAAGQAICALADLSRLRVEAEVDEFDAARVRLGDPVLILAEGHGERGWPGIVEEIPDAVTRPRLRPQDPSQPADTRVLLVKASLPEGTPLKLGQRVEVRLGRL